MGEKNQMISHSLSGYKKKALVLSIRLLLAHENWVFTKAESELTLVHEAKYFAPGLKPYLFEPAHAAGNGGGDDSDAEVKVSPASIWLFFPPAILTVT